MEKKKVPIKKIGLSILLVIALILVVLLVLTIHKVSVLKNLLAKASETDQNTNCYVRIEDNGETDAYVKGDNFKATKKIAEDLIDYGKFGDVTYWAVNFQRGRQKTYWEPKGEFISPLRTITPYIPTDTLWKVAVESKVRSTECNGKECYEIRLAKDLILWVEKDTGLVMRELNGNTTTNYSYQFGNVTDADVQMPDFTDYEKE